MKILYDYQIFYNQKYGGPSRYFIELHKNIIDFNHDAKIYLPIHVNNHIKENKISGIKEGLFLKRKFKLNSFLKLYNKFSTTRYLNSFNPDIIHPTYYDIGFYKKFKKPKVLTVYDLIHERYRELYNIKRDVLPKKEAIDNSDYYLCPSKCTQRDLIEYYNVKEEQTSVIYWAPFINKNHESKHLSYNNKKPYLLYVGNRHGYKNANLMIEAISLSKEIMMNYNVIFFGGGNFKKVEIDLFKKFNYSESQFKLINGNDQDLVNLYKNASALVYPSLYEGLGLPILEAMQFNCPVITSYTSGMIEAGGDAVEYFDPKKKESIVASIKKVLFSEGRQKELINLGQKRIDQFSWKRVGKETLNIYKKLC